MKTKVGFIFFATLTLVQSFDFYARILGVNDPGKFIGESVVIL